MAARSLSHICRLLPLVLPVAALLASCSDRKEPAADEVDRAYIGAWCAAMQVFRDDILSPDKQATPYATRNIAANERFVSAMRKMQPPEDTKAWHNEWTAAASANLDKLKKNDPSAQPDPLDVGPDTPLPDRLVALFSTLPECQAVGQPAPQPGSTGGGNGHANASAVLLSPGTVQVSFDYTYTADPPGKVITSVTVTPVGTDQRPLADFAPASQAATRGTHHADATLTLSVEQLRATAGFAICFAGPGEPDLGCLRLNWRSP